LRHPRSLGGLSVRAAFVLSAVCGHFRRNFGVGTTQPIFFSPFLNVFGVPSALCS
jgi:hypothetical protein